MVEGGIPKTSVIKMRDNFIEGVQIKTPLGEATLLKKYPHYASTDKGNWKWIEIYLAEHGMRCDDRKGLIKKRIEEVKAYYENRID